MPALRLDTALPPDSARSMRTAAATPARGADVSSLPPTGFMRQRDVLRLVPISKSTLWRRVKDRTFPEPVKLSARVTAWRIEDLRDWIRDAASR